MSAFLLSRGIATTVAVLIFVALVPQTSYKAETLLTKSGQASTIEAIGACKDGSNSAGRVCPSART